MSEQLRQAIHRYFAEFPENVREHIYGELLKPAGLVGLLQRLSLPTQGDPSAQYDALIGHLRRDGVERMIGSSPDRETRLLSPKPPPKGAPDEPPSERKIVLAQAPALLKRDESPSLRAEPTPALAPAAPQPSFPSGPLRPAPPPEAGSFDVRTPSWDASKPHDPEGMWPAVERRSGRERRRQEDRRKKIDIVYKNSRFGKDRRSTTERRKNWPTEGHKP
jgi:hypothetical protein